MEPTEPTKKIWGTTELIFAKNNTEVHRITVAAGGFCSEHVHQHKWNRFYVESGTLLVRRSVSGGGSELDMFACKLSAGQSFDVQPGVWHQFEAKEATIAYETYWVELGEDIERRTQGGVPF